MDAMKTYEYLVLSRGRVMDAVRGLSEEQYRRPFAFGLKTIASTVTHIMISEWYYVERLTGRTVPAYDRWPIQYEKPPAFEVVERAWEEQAAATRAAIAAERDWGRVVAYDTFADEEGRRFRISATAGDILTQLVLHEVHHRAQAMSMLREMAASDPAVRTVQDIDYNDMMYQRREIGRS